LGRCRHATHQSLPRPVHPSVPRVFYPPSLGSDVRVAGQRSLSIPYGCDVILSEHWPPNVETMPHQTALHACVGGGYLCGAGYPMPDTPSVRCHRDVIPCSNLVCADCEVAVRWFDGATSEQSAATLYADPQVEYHPKGSIFHRQRLYVCQCRKEVAVLPLSVRGTVGLEPYEGPYVPPLPWTCGGHEAPK